MGARWLGAERNPLSGMNSGHSGSDSLHHKLFIETKTTSKLTLYRLFRETEELAATEDKTPVIIQHFKNRKGFYVTVHKDHMAEFVSAYLAARGIYIDAEEIPTDPEE